MSRIRLTTTGALGIFGLTDSTHCDRPTWFLFLEKQRGTLVWFGIDCVSLFFWWKNCCLKSFLFLHLRLYLVISLQSCKMGSCCCFGVQFSFCSNECSVCEGNLGWCWWWFYVLSSCCPAPRPKSKQRAGLSEKLFPSPAAALANFGLGSKRWLVEKVATQQFLSSRHLSSDMGLALMGPSETEHGKDLPQMRGIWNGGERRKLKFAENTLKFYTIEY